MTENYSNEKRLEDLEKLANEFVTKVKEIREIETLQNIDFEDRVETFVEQILQLLYNEEIIDTNDFYSFSGRIRREIKKSIKDIFGCDCFKDFNHKVYPKSKK